MSAPTAADLTRENQELRQRLEEAEELIRAISSGSVDAFLVQKGAEDQVLVLDGVDKPYRLLIERMNQAAVTLTEDGTIIYANPSLSQLLGEGVANLIGTSIADYLQVSDRPAFERMLTDTKEDLELDALMLGANGQLIPVHLALATLLQPPRVLALIITDLTHQKKVEAERATLVAVQAAQKAAEAAAQSLRDADRRKDEFLAMLAHELRSPLAPIRNGLEILDRISSQEPEVLRTRQIMGRQVENLVRMVDDLLDVSRVSEGKIELRREQLDLRAAVNRALESAQSFINQKDQQLEVSLPDHPIPLQGDVIRICQTVVNLLSNASKFSPPGSDISLQVRQDGSQAIIEVKDGGIGIRPEMLPQIFELFAQANPTMGRSEGGLGIGLTLSRRLIELHGGKLIGTSDGLNKGSTFTIVLPTVEPGMAGPVAAKTGESAVVVEGRRVLVVDDNQDAAESLTVLLTLLGHVSRTETDSQQAVHTMREFRPDLVLLDIGMPGMSGYEIANMVRQLPELAGTRVVAVSGYGTERHRQRSLSTGFDGHLVKPVAVDQLKALLQSL